MVVNGISERGLTRSVARKVCDRKKKGAMSAETIGRYTVNGIRTGPVRFYTHGYPCAYWEPTSLGDDMPQSSGKRD